MSIWQIISNGGITMYVLLACSILSLTIIVQRSLYYKFRAKIKRQDFIGEIKKELEKGEINKAITICKISNAPFTSVVEAGLKLYGHSEKEIENSMQREIVVETTKLESFTSVVGTIGSVAVYIGLFGTVLGIIRAFSDIASSGAGGINVVIKGISEALACTAAGLCVAVPAVIAYNFFVKKIDNFVKDMELAAGEIFDLLTERYKRGFNEKTQTQAQLNSGN